MAIGGIGGGAGLGSQALSQLQGLQSGGQQAGAAPARGGNAQAAQPAGAQGFSIQGPGQAAPTGQLTQTAVQETRGENSRPTGTEPRAGDVPPPPAGSGRGQTLDISA
ncbi:MAG: hypothetical protein RLO01_11860 [Thalassobaculaceae bacterium]